MVLNATKLALVMKLLTPSQTFVLHHCGVVYIINSGIFGMWVYQLNSTIPRVSSLHNLCMNLFMFYKLIDLMSWGVWIYLCSFVCGWAGIVFLIVFSGKQYIVLQWYGTIEVEVLKSKMKLFSIFRQTRIELAGIRFLFIVCKGGLKG